MFKKQKTGVQKNIFKNICRGREEQIAEKDKIKCLSGNFGLFIVSLPAKLKQQDSNQRLIVFFVIKSQLKAHSHDVHLMPASAVDYCSPEN